jgi:hypothetical protein
MLRVARDGYGIAGNIFLCALMKLAASPLKDGVGTGRVSVGSGHVINGVRSGGAERVRSFLEAHKTAVFCGSDLRRLPHLPSAPGYCQLGRALTAASALSIILPSSFRRANQAFATGRTGE